MLPKMITIMVFTKVARVARSQYIVNAIKHFNELYHRPTFLIRSVKKIGSTTFHNFWGCFSWYHNSYSLSFHHQHLHHNNLHHNHPHHHHHHLHHRHHHHHHSHRMSNAMDNMSIVQSPMFQVVGFWGNVPQNITGSRVHHLKLKFQENSTIYLRAQKPITYCQ